jgi:hypothetical protein
MNKSIISKIVKVDEKYVTIETKEIRPGFFGTFLHVR